MDPRQEAFRDELKAAVEAGDVELLDNRLSLPPLGAAVTDDLIDKLLEVAALQLPFIEEVCHLLLNRMSDTLLADYKSDNDHFSPLHCAVWQARVAATEFFAVNLCDGYFIINNSCFGMPIFCFAASTLNRSLEVARVLLKHGANPNQVGNTGCAPILLAVANRNVGAVQFLLEEFGVDPCIGRQVQIHGHFLNLSPTQMAIILGNPQIISLLLNHGGFLGTCTVLAPLLCDSNMDRNTRLDICRIFHESVMAGSICPTVTSTLASLQATVMLLINGQGPVEGMNEGLAIILEAGIHPSFHKNRAFHHAIAVKNEAACRLLLNYGADPFKEAAHDGGGQRDYPTVSNYFNWCPTKYGDGLLSVHGGPGASPFHTAARQDDTFMFEYLLEVWGERFNIENNGANELDEYAIHAICRDKDVSLSAVQLLLMDGLALEALETHPHRNGHYPYEIAVMSGANLDVVFTLFQHHVHKFMTRDGTALSIA